MRATEPANDTAAPPLVPGRAPAVVRSTTRKARAAVPEDRRLDVLSPTLLAWVRAQPCEMRGCLATEAIQPHHHPGTGANGRQIDVLIVSACAICHRYCHDGRYSIADQQAAAHRTWAKFWRLAPASTQRAVIREIAASLGA